MSDVKKVSILGWYGHGNLGDEAMLEGLQFLLEKFFGARKFNVMTDMPTTTVPQFNFDMANDCDLFVYGGGEIIYPNYEFVSIKKWMQYVKPPKITVGCGVNAEIYEQFYQDILEGLGEFKHIGLRDATAYSILSKDENLRGKLGLILDPSMVLREKYNMQWENSDGVGVLIPTDRQDTRCDPGILKTNIVSVSQVSLKDLMIVDGIKKVILVPFGKEDNDDLVTCTQMQEFLSDRFDVSIREPTSIKDALDIIGNCQRVYAYRLHGLILAHMLGAPYDYVPYHRKLQRVQLTLQNLDYEKINFIMNSTWNRLKGIVEDKTNGLSRSE